MISFEGFWAGTAELEAAGALPSWARDTQARSRRTRERVLESAYRIVTESESATFTMAQLADDVGISVGAIYARFPSKQAVIAMLGLAVLEQGRVAIQKAIARTSSASDAMLRYTASITSLFRQHRPVIIELRRNAQEVPLLGQLIHRSNEGIHQVVRQRMLRDLGEDRASEVEYALFMASAAAREAILYRAHSVYQIDPTDEELGRTIGRAMCRYLRIEATG